MSLRLKILLLAVVPPVLAAAVLAIVVEHESSVLAGSQVAESEQILITAKQDELRHLMTLAQTAIRDLEDSSRDDKVTRSQVLARLRSLDYGEDGYFYVYDLHVPNEALLLVHPRLPDLENKNQWDLTDDMGTP